MKNVTFGFGIVLILILSIFIILSGDSRSIRQKETQANLSSTVAGVMNDLCLDRHYTIEDSDLFIADFVQAMTVRVTSDSNLTVAVLDVDTEKGFLTMEVKETFRYPNGKEGNVTAVKTILLEHEKESEEPKKYTLRYQVKQGEMVLNYCVNELFKDGIVIVPKAPEQKGKTFAGWTDVNGNLVSFQGTDGQPITIGELAGTQEEYVLTALFR